MASNLTGDINNQWVKTALQFNQTGQLVYKVVNNNGSLKELQKSATKLQEAVTELNFVLCENKPSTSTNQTASSSKKSSSRKRARSGDITLDEIYNSIGTSQTTQVPSVNELQFQNNILNKLKLLYSWEQDANRTNIRVAFHQGFYINKLLTDKDNTENNTIESIHQTTDIPKFNINKNVQLFKDLGTYRMLLYSTLPVYKLQRNIAPIRELLSSLPQEEREKWQNIPKELTADPSCFIKCYLDWFEGKQLPNDIFYNLDLLDNRMNHPTAEPIIDKLCSRVVVCKDQHDMHAKLLHLSEEKYLLGYIKKTDGNGHFTILKKDSSDGKYFGDEISQNDFILETPWTQTIIYVFK